MIAVARNWWGRTLAMRPEVKRIAIVCGIAMAVVLLLQAVPLVFPTTESVKYHLLLKSSKLPQKGDYVNVEVFHEVISKDQAVTLTKRVACVAGEVLRTDGSGRAFCNGTYLGQALERTTKGVVLPRFAWNGPVPAGKVYLSGDHPRSFDSRYFGFVNASALVRLIPVF